MASRVVTGMSILLPGPWRRGLDEPLVFDRMKKGSSQFNLPVRQRERERGTLYGRLFPLSPSITSLRLPYRPISDLEGKPRVLTVCRSSSAWPSHSLSLSFFGCYNYVKPSSPAYSSSFSCALFIWLWSFESRIPSGRKTLLRSVCDAILPHRLAGKKRISFCPAGASNIAISFWRVAISRKSETSRDGIKTKQTMKSNNKVFFPRRGSSPIDTFNAKRIG